MTPHLYRRTLPVLILLFLTILLASCGYMNSAFKAAKPSLAETTKIEAPSERDDPNSYTALNYSTVKAMWLSQYDLAPICVKDGIQRPVADYTRRIRAVIDNITAMGFNTIFVQVRPNGDSLYPSALFPSSPYAVGTIGMEFAYDPFAILLELAHGSALSVHAWINPLRCFTEANRQLLSSGSSPLPAFCDGDRMVYVNNTWYWNPAYPQARSYIAKGVTELLNRYPIDGIHMDDYFYPTADTEFDRIAYAAYQKKGGCLSLPDFRREQINLLVSELYSAVHSASGARLFGISPGGNTDRNYHELYADVAAWCGANGYIDYLCPQAYWGFEHDTVPFDRVCTEFSNMVEGTEIQLFIGMTLGKAYDGFYACSDPYAGNGSQEWIEHRDILKRCVIYTSSLPNCNGIAFFSYQFFFSPENGKEIEATDEERRNFLPLLRDFFYE